MSRPPQVTVIIPTFNYARFIGAAVESIQAQTYRDWECIVVDDGSEDNTHEVIQPYMRMDARLQYIHQCNLGLSAARNTGIRHSRGRYLQFLDADDLIERDKLKLQVAFLENHSDVDLIYSEVRYFRDGNTNERRLSMMDSNIDWMPRVSGSGEDVLHFLIEKNIMAVNAALVQKTVIDEIGPFDESLRSLEDWDYWLRFSLRGKRFHFDGAQGTLALVRSHGHSMSRDNRRMITAAMTIRERLKVLIPEPDLRQLNENRLFELGRWISGVEVALSVIPKMISSGEEFILIDEDQIATELPSDYRSIPFLEQDGQYWGPPENDEAAIMEAKRLQHNGAKFIVITYPAFWWMEYYTKFLIYLRSECEKLIENDQIAIYKFQRSLEGSGHCKYSKL